MMKQMMELAKLNDNHKLLADLAGSWSTSVKMMEPGKEPTVSKGSVTYKSIMNGRYFVGDHTGSMKMPEPTMFPATTIVASTGPSLRRWAIS